MMIVISGKKLFSMMIYAGIYAKGLPPCYETVKLTLGHMLFNVDFEGLDIWNLNSNGGSVTDEDIKSIKEDFENKR